MNRRQRRAAGKEGDDRPAHDADEIDASDFGAKSNIGQIKVHDAQHLSDTTPAGLPAPPKQGVLARFFMRMLLSQWVISRVNNSNVEQLLITLALQSGRPEIADQILRRQALRQSARV